MPRKLIVLTWADIDGEPYHEARLSAATARDVLGADGWQLYLDGHAHPMRHLTAAAVGRAGRACARRLYEDQPADVVTIDVCVEGRDDAKTS